MGAATATLVPASTTRSETDEMIDISGTQIER